MKFVKKVKILNNGIHTNKYYFLGIRYLKKYGLILSMKHIYSKSKLVAITINQNQQNNKHIYLIW